VGCTWAGGSRWSARRPATAHLHCTAGASETTLLADWVCGGGREVAWLSLDEQDNNLVQFLRYLIAALQQVDGRVGGEIEALLRGAQLPPSECLASLLINDLAAVSTPLTLVLDDYQLITSSDVHRLLGHLIDHQPPAVHLAIGTREDPPLPLARLRARGQVTEVRESVSNDN
jgi:LuxR family maltose regulon positive regulatory protein